MTFLKHLFIFVLLSSLFGKGIKFLKKISCLHIARNTSFQQETLKLHSGHSSHPILPQLSTGCKGDLWPKIGVEENILNEPLSPGNIRGSLSLAGMLFVLFVLGFFLYTFVNILETHKKVKERAHAYLCFKYQMILVKKYVANIGKLNRIIRTSFYAKNSQIPKVSQAATMIHQAALISQNATHLRYLSQHLNNDYCHAGDSVFFIGIRPYLQKGLLLERNFDGTTILGRAQWTIHYYKKEILLHASLALESPLSTTLGIATKEKTSVGLPNWRASFGSVF